MAENNGTASDRAASRAIRLRQQLSALSCQLSVISSLRLGRRECRVFVATSPTLFPVSRRGTLSAIRHRLRESRARATRRLLPASRRIPPASPLRQPLPPSPSPSPARRAGSQVYFLRYLPPCTVRTRDASARRWSQVPAFRRQLQCAAGRAWQPECRRRP